MTASVSLLPLLEEMAKLKLDGSQIAGTSAHGTTSTDNAFLNLPSDILEYLFVTVAWSSTRQAVSRELMALTYVCRAWLHLVRRIEFLRLHINLSSRKAGVFLERVQDVRRSGDARLQTRELGISCTAKPLYSVSDVLWHISTSSIATFHYQANYPLPQLTVQRLGGMLFPTLQNLHIAGYDMHLVRDLFGEMDLSRLADVHLSVYSGPNHDAEAGSPWYSSICLPQMTALHLLVSERTVGLLCHLMLHSVSPRLETVSIYVADSLVQPTIDAIMSRTTCLMTELKLNIRTPVGLVDQTHPKIVALMKHAQDLGWQYNVTFHSLTKQWTATPPQS